MECLFLFIFVEKQSDDQRRSKYRPIYNQQG
jgi:hypothetical protein